MSLALLSPRVWAELIVIVIVVAAGWWAYNWVYDRGAASVQAQWDKERTGIDKQSAKITADALAATKGLVANMESQRSSTNAQISALNNSLASAVAGLRERPARDSAGGVPRDPATGSAVGATGAQLLRDDSELLTREAARADRLRLQLAECQVAYANARKAVNGP
jgi:hypothetical protein